MANIEINNKVDRTFTYSGVFQIESGVNTYQLKFIKEITVTYDDTDLERDRIDDGTPAFTRIGDVLGSFSFRMGNTVDLSDTVDPATNDRTKSYWIEKLVTNDPAQIKFIETKQAPDSLGNKFDRHRFTGRIMKVEQLREEDVGINDDLIEGEIILFTSQLREAS